MSQNEMIMLIVGSLAGICFLWAVIKRPGYSLMVVARGIFCVLLLYGIQLCCLKFGWGEGVSVNALTAAVSGVLGLPGIILLYLIKWYCV
ncbi:MAG: pro-sigmaK processing inhibitor BofA family protein [Lachnospiraceae bacterium]|nr:pro-sigmaK processing inhibitor BofA family protein [Lachnospiraceae bacterium]